MFNYFTKFTGVKVNIKDHTHGGEVKRVYDFGNGAFIYAYASNDVRYLRSDGKFMDNDYYMCNGDAVSWESHIGDIKKLNFKDKQ